MVTIHSFTFNLFQENTYVVAVGRDAWIIDPGCSNGNERKMLESYLKKEGLNAQAIINTHCHIDHVLGNKWCKEHFNIPLYIPQGEEKVLHSLMVTAQVYGVPAEPSPEPDALLTDGQLLSLGASEWRLISAPGHSPASICLFQDTDRLLISGDVLFYESIGRTDLPGGNHQLLLHNIRTKLFVLPDEVIVYNGHGPSTTIGHEKKHNPFLN